MLISKLFFPVLREVSADAKLKSHQIMLKAGMIRQSAAGIYSWLPLGLKVLKKIEQVVREEQNKSASGAHLSVIKGEFRKMYQSIETNENRKRFVGVVFMDEV